MRISRMAGVVVGSLVVLAGVAAQALVITTAGGNGADASILGHGTGPGSQEVTNFNTGGGLNGDLLVQDFTYNMTDGNGRTYLRFGLPGSGQSMGSGAMVSTSLTLTINSATAGFNYPAGPTSRITFLGLNSHYLGGVDGNLNNTANGEGVVPDLGYNWGETAINWANAPGHLAQQDGNSGGTPQWQAANATVLGTMDLSWASLSDGSQIVLSGPALTNWMLTNTDGLLTIFMVDQILPVNTDWYQGGARFLFYSKDTTYNLSTRPLGGSVSSFPTLTLIPEPTAAMLLLAGATALGLRRRRT